MFGTELSQDEFYTLNFVYDFSKKRKFQYGINERYIRRNKDQIESLFKKKLVFFKKCKGHIYWFPTLKGRDTIDNALTKIKGGVRYDS